MGEVGIIETDNTQRHKKIGRHPLTSTTVELYFGWYYGCNFLLMRGPIGCSCHIFALLYIYGPNNAKNVIRKTVKLIQLRVL
jgi:ribosomal protein L30/L7E